mmetsp:Transcript_20783/g.62007  ORF Transcript_20783/g.62007 Transcript_20783/m.62007 type:complete len:462 (+) Transcript_20783:724-2109(+)
MGQPQHVPRAGGRRRGPRAHRGPRVPPALLGLAAQHLGHVLRGTLVYRDRSPEPRRRGRRLLPQHWGRGHLALSSRGRRGPVLERGHWLLRLRQDRGRPRHQGLRPRAVPRERDAGRGQDDRDQALAGRQARARRHPAGRQDHAAHRRGARAGVRAVAHGLREPAAPQRLQRPRGPHALRAGAPRALGRQADRLQALRGPAARVRRARARHAAHGGGAGFHHRGRRRGRHGRCAARVPGLDRHAARRGAEIGRGLFDGRGPPGPGVHHRRGQGLQRLLARADARARRRHHQLRAVDDVRAGLYPGAQVQQQQVPDGHRDAERRALGRAARAHEGRARGPLPARDGARGPGDHRRRGRAPRARRHTGHDLPTRFGRARAQPGRGAHGVFRQRRGRPAPHRRGPGAADAHDAQVVAPGFDHVRRQQCGARAVANGAVLRAPPARVSPGRPRRGDRRMSFEARA